MSLARSSASWKSGDGVSDQFPAGLRVLVVDDDTTCLRILEKMLTTCLYEVTKCSRPEVALKILRDNKDGFDIVISDVHMPDMDGFKLLEHIGLEMDLPVIMMSADDSKKVVMKGVTHGACDYLIKPVHMEALKNIWQHMVRRKRHEWEDKDNEQSRSVEDGERQNKQSEDVDCGSSANEGSSKSSKKRKDEEDEGEERDDSSTSKKPRVVWSTELHQQFVNAVNQLGIDKAVPKKILELMNVLGLTRENVASHLQKYRVYLRRLSGQQQNGLGNSFIGHHDPAFGSLTSLSGLDYQNFTSSVQLPAANKPLMSVGSDDPRNIFTFGSPKIRFVEGQIQQNNNNNKRVNLLHGIPTNMDLKAFGNMNVPILSQNNPLQMQMAQQQPRSQVLNDVGGAHALNIPSSVGPPAIPGALFGRNGVGAPAYASIPQSTNMADFSRNQRIDLPRTTTFPNSAIELEPEMNGSRTGFVPNYDVFYNGLNQNRTDDWGMQGVGSNFEHSNTQCCITASSSDAENLSRMKSGTSPEMGFQNGLFLDHQFGGDDLMSTLLKQSQESAIPLEGEFDFDEGFQLDPV